MLLYIILLIIILAIAYSYYRLLKSKKIIGKQIIVKPVKSPSQVDKLMPLIIELQEVKRFSREDVWFFAMLDEPRIVSDKKLDFIMIKTKNGNDYINNKKAVICRIKAGESSNPNKTYSFGYCLAAIREN